MKKTTIWLPITSMLLSILGLLILQGVDSTWSSDELSTTIGLPSAGLGIGILSAINQREAIVASVVGIILGGIGVYLSISYVMRYLEQY